MKKLFLLLFMLGFLKTTEAQTTRYLDQIFTDTTRSTIVYGSNWTVLTLATTGRTAKSPLVSEVLMPKGDTETKRPVVIYLHTGNFLPLIPGRTGPSGLRTDSTALEICARMARMGYVAFSADYRLGWDPTNDNQIVRTATLINAAYRGIQDIRTLIRHIKLNANTYKVDTSKIIVWGQGTGGYLSLGLATLDNQAEIENTKFGPQKFFLPGATPIPMVHPTINGDVDARGNTAVPAALVPFGYPLGDSLNSTPLGNIYGVTSNYQLTVNMGGALGDLSWMDTTSITGSLGATGKRPFPTPIISFHVPYDPFAPYDDDILNVPRPAPLTPLPVVRVQGSFRVSLKADSLGINNAFSAVKNRDPYGAVQKARSSSRGMFPLFGTAGNPFDSSPWDFWASTNPNDSIGRVTNPNMSAAKARRYIDTMVGFVAPRACVVLNLPCKGIVNSTEDLLNASTTKLTVAPNPAQSYITFESEVYNPMRAIELYDMSGRLVRQVAKVDNHQFNMMRGSLPTGMYIAKVRFEGGILSKKVVFEDR